MVKLQIESQRQIRNHWANAKSQITYGQYVAPNENKVRPSRLVTPKQLSVMYLYRYITDSWYVLGPTGSAPAPRTPGVGSWPRTVAYVCTSRKTSQNTFKPLAHLQKNFLKAPIALPFFQIARCSIKCFVVSCCLLQGLRTISAATTAASQ